VRVAEHFNLREDEFTFTGATDSLADQAFLSGGADALFRIRALGNPAIQRLAGAGAIRFLPISQAAAMKIRYPAFQPALIPAGAYFDEPPVPPTDVPAIAVNRRLLARAGYYDKDKPSFLKANADYIGLLLSVVVMLGSWIWQLKSWMTRQQKNAGDAYTSRVIQTMMDAQSAESPTALDALKTDLLATLTSAVSDSAAETSRDQRTRINAPAL
jgi:hypothetical protein